MASADMTVKLDVDTTAIDAILDRCACAVVECGQSAKTSNRVETRMEVVNSPKVRLYLCDKHYAEYWFLGSDAKEA